MPDSDPRTLAARRLRWGPGAWAVLITALVYAGFSVWVGGFPDSVPVRSLLGACALGPPLLLTVGWHTPYWVATGLLVISLWLAAYSPRASPFMALACIAIWFCAGLLAAVSTI